MIIKSLAFSVMMAGSAVAGPDRVSLSLGSSHVNLGDGWEEVNPGAFLTWERDRVNYSVGAFRNSHGKGAIAAFVGYDVIQSGDFEAGLFIGAALYPGDGRYYDVHVGDLIPMGGIQVQYKNTFVQYMPTNADAGVMTFGLTWELN